MAKDVRVRRNKSLVSLRKKAENFIKFSAFLLNNCQISLEIVINVIVVSD